MKIEHDMLGMLDEESGEIVYSLVRHRVGECPYCDRKRAARISYEFIDRLDVAGIPSESLHMWSLGCSLRDTSYNRVVLAAWFRQFCEKMKRSGWLPCFRVLESGKRGYLHFHVVVSGYVEHRLVLEVWRGITGELSNVNVSTMSGSPDQLVRYLIKYVTKTTNGGGQKGAYRWLGPLYGIKVPRQGRRRKVSMVGSVPYKGPKVPGYRSRSEQRKIDK